MIRYYVFMGRVDRLNGKCHYIFPTRQAAEKFAASARRRHPGRAVIVQEVAL